MRGKQCIDGMNTEEFRITPADAGKTVCIVRKSRQSWDHPRGCGENRTQRVQSQPQGGSPPRMRGKPLSPRVAGRTAMDHPRGCGENVQRQPAKVFRPGSPPRMRGKLGETCMVRHAVGITPADAGKTLKRSFRNQPFCS